MPPQNQPTPVSSLCRSCLLLSCVGSLVDRGPNRGCFCLLPPPASVSLLPFPIKGAAASSSSSARIHPSIQATSKPTSGQQQTPLSLLLLHSPAVAAGKPSGHDELKSQIDKAAHARARLGHRLTARRCRR